jgi:outer membrane protein assembly factor BamB
MLCLSGCWWQDGWLGTRTADNLLEGTITPANVGSAHQVWSASFPTSSIGHPYTDGTNVYVHDDNTVRAFNETTGAALWTDSLPSDVTGQLTIADGRLLVPVKASSSNALVVVELRPSDGQLITEDIFPAADFLAGSIATDGTNSAIAVRTTTGTSQVWYGAPASPTAPTFTHEVVVASSSITAPAIDGNQIVVGGFNQAFDISMSTDPTACVPATPCRPLASSASFTAADGSVPADGLFTDHPVVVTAGRPDGSTFDEALLATEDGRLIAFDLPDLASTTILDTMTRLSATAPAAADDRLLTQTADGRVYSFSTTDCLVNAAASGTPCAPGTVLQTTALTPFDPVVQPEVAGQVVYAYSSNGSLSSWPLECQPSGSAGGLPLCPSISTIPMSGIRGATVADGTILVTTANGLTAFRVDT